MILGIFSDTHGDTVMAHEAVRLLVGRGAAFLIHCGDVGGEHVLEALADVPSAFVFGNNDHDQNGLRVAAVSLGIDCLGEGGILRLGNAKLGVTHGDDPRQVEKLLTADGPCDYLFTGHSHRRHDKRVGDTRWINPGALYRAVVRTCATLDLTTDTLDVLTVERPRR